MAEAELVEPCPVCGREEAGYGECPEAKAERQQSEEWIEPVDCPCCDTCRKKCADSL